MNIGPYIKAPSGITERFKNVCPAARYSVTLKSVTKGDRAVADLDMIGLIRIAYVAERRYRLRLHQEVRMKTLLLLSILIGASLLSAAAPVETQRKHLNQPTVIQGYPCARDYAWFFPDGSLYRCTFSREFDFGDARIPEGSIVHLLPNGSFDFVMLNHNTVISGALCSGGGLLGPEEGAMTALYPGGILKSCFLARDQTVQGVPCASGGFWKAIFAHEQAVVFYPSGKLKSCGLSQEFANQKRGDGFLQSP